jgi:hypothetical protein
MSHFSMGAINKITNSYEPPIIASKTNKYKCPCCEKNVIFRKGKVKQPHFAHYKSENPCHYYDRPNESQIHKDAKLLMKSLLDDKKNICITRKCDQANCNCNNNVGYCISYTENTKAYIEHRFHYNDSNKSADVALVENDVIKYIFEICHTNKTKEENRPEPWFEISAEDLIRKINSGECIDEDSNINIECIRNYRCDKCIELKLRHENFIKEQSLREEQERQRADALKTEMRKHREAQERERLEKYKDEILEANMRWENEQYEIQEKWIRDDEERQRQEQVMPEMMKQLKLECGFDRIVSKAPQPCSCDMHVCICVNPKYELVKLSNNLFCVKCNKWKCRCS